MQEEEEGKAKETLREHDGSGARGENPEDVVSSRSLKTVNPEQLCHTPLSSRAAVGAACRPGGERARLGGARGEPEAGSSAAPQQGSR